MAQIICLANSWKLEERCIAGINPDKGQWIRRWKLIAGVIELSESDLILVEMKRLGWSIAQGREYLQRTYDKQSRKQLTATEITQFLSYLKSLPRGSP